MKYFQEPTTETEALDPDFNTAGIKSYQEYIHSVWDVLPKELQRLYVRGVPFSPNVIYLNDSRIQTVRSDFAARTVEIVLQGDALNEWGYAVGARHFHLWYRGVERLDCTGKRGMFWPASDIDHIWDEIEVLDGGRFEHRMLFRGEIEMRIVFGEFSLTYTDTLRETTEGE